MPRLLRLAVPGLALLLTGCAIPVPKSYDYWETAHHHGIVLDADSRLPISGARVAVVPTPNLKNARRARTAVDGSFDIQPIVQHRYLYWISPFPADGGCHDSVTVEYPGYATENIKERKLGDPNAPCTGLEYTHEILLHKAS